MLVTTANKGMNDWGDSYHPPSCSTWAASPSCLAGRMSHPLTTIVCHLCQDSAVTPELNTIYSPLFAAWSCNILSVHLSFPWLGHALLLTSSWLLGCKHSVQSHSHCLVPKRGAGMLQDAQLQPVCLSTSWEHRCGACCPQHVFLWAMSSQPDLQALQDYTSRLMMTVQKCLCNSPQSSLLWSMAWTLFPTHSLLRRRNVNKGFIRTGQAELHDGGVGHTGPTSSWWSWSLCFWVSYLDLGICMEGLGPMYWVLCDSTQNKSLLWSTSF